MCSAGVQMSLFEGLFGGGGAKKASSLFKESSKYKRSNNEFVEEAQEGVKSRKRKVGLGAWGFIDRREWRRIKLFMRESLGVLITC